jgi:hypothetical protein
MAITRATGKAARLAFSWIVSMSGFEVTPAEEMPQVIENKSNGTVEVVRDRKQLYDTFQSLWHECLNEGILAKDLVSVSADAPEEEIVEAGKANRALLNKVSG